MSPTGAPTWYVGPPSLTPRICASSVLLPRTSGQPFDEVGIFGGRDASNTDLCAPALATARRITITAPTPPAVAPVFGTWSAPIPMGTPAEPRVFQNVVILPDGKLFLVGGSRGHYPDLELPNPPGCSAVLGLNDAHFVPLLYDPVAGTWTPMASHASPHIYHSFAILLQDGRVLVGGGIRPAAWAIPPYSYVTSDAEVWSPPYLFMGPRPRTAKGSPTSLPYGQGVTFSVSVPTGSTLGAMSLVRPGSVTHGFDMEQRMVRLAFETENVAEPDPPTGFATHTITLNGPVNEHEAPPGWYMLFAVTNQGVPSIAKFVHVP